MVEVEGIMLDEHTDLLPFFPRRFFGSKRFLGSNIYFVHLKTLTQTLRHGLTVTSKMKSTQYSNNETLPKYARKYLQTSTYVTSNLSSKRKS